MPSVVTGSPGRNLERFLVEIALQPAVLVQVDAVEGSVPREAGAWMAVFQDTLVGTVGGGHLEFDAIVQARVLMTSGAARGLAKTVRFVLGPSLGQCCVGVVNLRFECVGVQDLAALRLKLQPVSQPVALFGGGHVVKIQVFAIL